MQLPLNGPAGNACRNDAPASRLAPGTLLSFARSRRGGAFAAFALLGIAAAGAQAQGPAAPPLPQTHAPLTIGQVFTFLFVMLGPLKIIGPFARMTRNADAAFRRRLAVRGDLISAIAVIAGAYAGQYLLLKWSVPLGTLLVAGGVILFLVALHQVLQQYATPTDPGAPPSPDAAGTPPPTMQMAFSPLAFPTIVTPYGVATLIVLLANRPDDMRILGLVAVVMTLNLLAMLYADRILKTPGVASILLIIGTVLSVLQVALGLQMLFVGLYRLGIITLRGV
jgi:multiple antibiotic resistance protein